MRFTFKKIEQNKKSLIGKYAPVIIKHRRRQVGIITTVPPHKVLLNVRVQYPYPSETLPIEHESNWRVEDFGDKYFTSVDSAKDWLNENMEYILKNFILKI